MGASTSSPDDPATARRGDADAVQDAGPEDTTAAGSVAARAAAPEQQPLAPGSGGPEGAALEDDVPLAGDAGLAGSAAHGPDGPRSDGCAAPESGGAGPEGSGRERGTAPAPAAPVRSRRFPLFTRDTARPEGGGRAAPGGAAAPVRQWPFLTVLGAVALGLLLVGVNAFGIGFRLGTLLIGLALIAAAVLRRLIPSVGMLAVRSRFTDMATYGLLGIVIVLLALMAQPKPWLEIPFLESAVRFTVR
ncbi:DUF3017 domain-containing protein [Streptomyces sp. ISL-98]|uniref:DUF3017 domain-containing protein n=1 Tax=Streptomyces sp. ISL-98 TaxID=2819192 RepID=UPI001BE4EBAD|nr:DUF3017 domain-containing protein [Streptomyces sp. ISL-98]MBT2507178.1 DUF3017 domain-containing protein [Streptomyces sp. ISL-98]